MNIGQKLAISILILFSVSLLMTPTVYAAIEKVENYAKEICIMLIEVIGMAKIAIFKNQKMNKNIIMI